MNHIKIINKHNQTNESNVKNKIYRMESYALKKIIRAHTLWIYSTHMNNRSICISFSSSFLCTSINKADKL